MVTSAPSAVIPVVADDNLVEMPPASELPPSHSAARAAAARVSAAWQTPVSSQGLSDPVTPQNASDRAVDAQLSAEADRLLNLADRPTPEVSHSGGLAKSASFAISRPYSRPSKRMRSAVSPSFSGEHLDRLVREMHSCRNDFKRDREDLKRCREEDRREREENNSLIQALTSKIECGFGRVADTVAAVVEKQEAAEIRMNAADVRMDGMEESRLCSEALNTSNVSKLEARLTKLEEKDAQRSNENKLVLRCVPGATKLTQFDAKALVAKMSAAMGLRLADRAIRYVAQFPNVSRRQSTMIVEFDDRASRTAFFNAYLVKRDLDARHLGFATPSRIYVGEMLTKVLSEVRDQAIKLMKAGRLSQVNTMHGQVWVTANGGARSRPTSLQELQAIVA